MFVILIVAMVFFGSALLSYKINADIIDGYYKQVTADPFAKADEKLYLRYSAAVGMAECASDDSTFEPVFKRADKAMYEDKVNFKAQNGTYRQKGKLHKK